MQRLSVGLLGLALMFAGCGGDDDGGGRGDADLRARYVDAITATEKMQSSSLALTGDEARCFAETTVDAIGVADLEDAGLTPDEIEDAGAFDPESAGVDVTDEDATTLYDGLSGCFDVRARFLEPIAAFDLYELDCVDRAIDDDMLREFFVSTLFVREGTVDADVMADFQSALLPCVRAGALG